MIGKSSAGHGFAGVCGAGEAVRIFTGAPVPPGADTVLVQEDAQRDDDRVTPTASIASGRNIRREGIDFREGETILRRGHRLTPADIALAASADHATLPLARAPRIGVLATGDELVAPGASRGPDQIVASNTFFRAWADHGGGRRGGRSRHRPPTGSTRSRRRLPARGRKKSTCS